jgi:hypothetical protein
MTSLLELCQTTLLRVNEQSTIVRESIFEAMELRAIKNGQITRHQIVDILDEFRNGIREDARAQIELIQAVPGVNRRPGDGGEDAATRIGGCGEQGTLYTYFGRFWDVPHTFAFPVSVKRDVSWRLWLQGMPAERRDDTEHDKGISQILTCSDAEKPCRGLQVALEASIFKDGEGFWRYS